MRFVFMGLCVGCGIEGPSGERDLHDQGRASDDVLARLLEHVAIEQIDGVPTVVIHGANLHIRNGLGQTACADRCNGAGNLVIGYGEGDGLRSGSHNLVVGPGHSYTAHGGLLQGADHVSDAPFGSAIGGAGNLVEGFGAVAVGGSYNQVLGPLGVVAGGLQNLGGGESSAVLGGSHHHAAGLYGVAVGGQGNVASGIWSTAVGGGDNEAAGRTSTVSGGRDSEVVDDYGASP